MTTQPFTARTVTKFVVTAIIADRVSGVTAETITDLTPLEEDSTAVFLGSRVIGWYISDKARPVTDKIVDKTADFVTAKREARKAKKTAKKEQKD